MWSVNPHCGPNIHTAVQDLTMWAKDQNCPSGAPEWAGQEYTRRPKDPLDYVNIHFLGLDTLRPFLAHTYFDFITIHQQYVYSVFLFSNCFHSRFDIH